jgi:hypothetical protein
MAQAEYVTQLVHGFGNLRHIDTMFPDVDVVLVQIQKRPMLRENLSAPLGGRISLRPWLFRRDIQ